MKYILIIPALFLVACAEKSLTVKNQEETKKAARSSFMTRPQPMEPVRLQFDKEYSGSKPFRYRKNDSLKMSGSAMFSEKALREIAKPVKRDKDALYIFDLRQESHGYINDDPVTWSADREWSNADLTYEEVIRRERRLLGDMHIGDKLGSGSIKSLETEESMVRTKGHQYHRITVTDHVRPVDADVDRFIEIVRELPENAWVHFHCRSGLGRTTTFMIIYDMLKSAKFLSYDEIIERNIKLSADTDVVKIGLESDWKYPFQKERVAFFKGFYEYAKENHYGKDKLWSEWARN